MGDSVVHGDRAFADRSRTTAEILIDLSHAIREDGGNDIIIEGCNTIGYLAAGIFGLHGRSIESRPARQNRDS